MINVTWKRIETADHSSWRWQSIDRISSNWFPTECLANFMFLKQDPTGRVFFNIERVQVGSGILIIHLTSSITSERSVGTPPHPRERQKVLRFCMFAPCPRSVGIINRAEHWSRKAKLWEHPKTVSWPNDPAYGFGLVEKKLSSGFV